MFSRFAVHQGRPRSPISYIFARSIFARIIEVTTNGQEKKFAVDFEHHWATLAKSSSSNWKGGELSLGESFDGRFEQGSVPPDPVIAQQALQPSRTEGPTAG